MKKRIFVLLAVGCGMAAWGQMTDATPVIEAGGLVFTKAEFEALAKVDPRFLDMGTNAEKKKMLGREFGKAFALEAEARRRKLDELATVKAKIRNYAMQLLANELLVTLRGEFSKNEAALQAHLAKRREFYMRPRVRQVLVRFQGSQVAPRPGLRELSEAEALEKAKALRAKIAGGADMAVVAKAESDDVASREQGGDMGFVMRGATAAAFEAAAFAAPVGQLSEVVRTEYGYHILRVEAREVEALEKIRGALANELAHEEMAKLLVNGYKLNEGYFGK